MATKVDPPEGTCPAGKHQFMLWRSLFEIDTRYTPIKPIGKGAYGVVCSARNTETGEKIAIKKISNAFENATDARRTLREIRLLRHLYHENIIAVKDIMKPTGRYTFNDVYVVYELMDTDLHQIIRSSQALTDDHCQYFIYQVSSCSFVALKGQMCCLSSPDKARSLCPSLQCVCGSSPFWSSCSSSS